MRAFPPWAGVQGSTAKSRQVGALTRAHREAKGSGAVLGWEQTGASHGKFHAAPSWKQRGSSKRVPSPFMP